MRHRGRALLLACALIAAWQPASEAVARPSADGQFAIGLLQSVNVERQRVGLRPLRADARLSRAATFHAGDVARQGVLGHTSSDGTPMQIRVRRFCRAKRVGETLAWLPLSMASSPSAAVAAWMSSPSHRAAILSRRFSRVGVGRRPAALDGPGVAVTLDLASAR